MDKETFVKLIETIEKHYKKDSKLINTIEKDINNSNRGENGLPVSFECLRNWRLYEDLIKIIGDAVNDESDWIGYYMWELDFGRKNRMDYKDRYTITDKDGKDVPCSTPSELYDCIKNV